MLALLVGDHPAGSKAGSSRIRGTYQSMHTTRQRCYASVMQTTLRIADEVYRLAKAEAAREGITLTPYQAHRP
jgi:hypothetical protein